MNIIWETKHIKQAIKWAITLHHYHGAKAVGGKSKVKDNNYL